MERDICEMHDAFGTELGGTASSTKAYGSEAILASNISRRELAWNGRMWMCKRCFFRTIHPASPSPTRLICPGKSVHQGLLADPRGHRLWVGDLGAGNKIIYCNSCWRYACAYPRGLRHECAGPSAVVRPSVRFYLQRGRHPISRMPFRKPFRLVESSSGRLSVF